jgi:ketosteroid isomerase-like protein
MTRARARIGHMSDLTHGDAQDLVARLKRAWEKRDVEEAMACFADDAELRPDPFDSALTDQLAIRAWCTAVAAALVHAEADAERIWIAGDTVLVAFHGAWTERATTARTRVRGMLSLELGPDRRIRRARAWALHRVVGPDTTVGPTGAPAGSQV